MDEKLANALADHIVCQSFGAFGAAHPVRRFRGWLSLT